MCARNAAALLLPVLAFLACAIVLIHTRDGIGLHADSAIFFASARSLASGGGLSVPFSSVTMPGDPPVPLTHHPPLYLFLLTPATKLGWGLQSFARWLNCVLMFGTVFFLGQAGRRFTGSREWGLATAALAACSLEIQYVFHYAGTDAPGIFLLSVGLFQLSRALGGSMSGVFLAAVAFGLAAVTRYACFFYIPGAALALLAGSGRPLRRRLPRSFAFAFCAVVPTVLVYSYNLMAHGNATKRHVSYHSPGIANLVDGASLLSSWLLPYRLPLLVRGAAFIAFLALVLLETKRELKPRGGVTSLALLTAYSAGVLTTMFFLDIGTSLDWRMLAPAITLLSLLAGSNLHAFAGVFGTRWARATAALLMMGIVVLNSLRTTSFVRQENANPSSSMNALERRYRGLRECIGMLPDRTAIYTNNPLELYLLLGVEARIWPRTADYTTGLPRSRGDVERDLAKIRAELAHSGAAVVHMQGGSRRPMGVLLESQELLSRLSLRESCRGGGCVVYR